MKLGASDDIINKTEENMGVRFPESLRQVWLLSNGLELPGGWQFFPVYNPAEPKRTCNHIGYENTRGRWSYMDESYVSIAAGDTGNQLVLKNNNGILEETIYLWNHETNKTKKWGKDFGYLLLKARARVEKIEKQIAKSIRIRNA